jgi:tRNA pseudouridine38-40 synthase
MAKNRYFIELSYNGNNYHGWQKQTNAITIQQKIEEVLSTLLSENIETIGAGRTDTGVHARNFIAHFDSCKDGLEKNYDLIYRLNCLLPYDIVVHKIYLVKPHNHARYDAISRTYRYYITQSKNPFNHDFSYFLYGNIDIDKMNDACKYLLKYDDFASFSKLHSNNKTTLCTIFNAEWSKKDDYLIFTIRANRFLRDMVRAIVGTLLKIGFGKISIEDFIRIIETKKRSEISRSVPAKGLFLEDIEYPYDFRK